MPIDPMVTEACEVQQRFISTGTPQSKAWITAEPVGSCGCWAGISLPLDESRLALAIGDASGKGILQTTPDIGW